MPTDNLLVMSRIRQYWTAFKNVNKKRILFKTFSKMGPKRFKQSLDGKIYAVPVFNGMAVNINPSQEPWMMQVIRGLLRLKAGSFVDVGVNMGQTLLKVKSVNPECHYYGFEPNPACCYYVQELIRLNGLNNCKVFPAGLSDRDDVVNLFLNSTCDGGASIIKGFRRRDQYSSEINVLVFEGSSFLAKLGISVSIIKIDVEGAELEVIQGLRTLIKRDRPFIICEVLPIYEETNLIGKFRKERQRRLETLLEEIGYCIFRIMDNGYPTRIDLIGTHADLALSNYIFVPSTVIESFCSSLGCPT